MDQDGPGSTKCWCQRQCQCQKCQCLRPGPASRASRQESRRLEVRHTAGDGSGDGLLDPAVAAGTVELGTGGYGDWAAGVSVVPDSRAWCPGLVWVLVTEVC